MLFIFLSQLLWLYLTNEINTNLKTEIMTTNEAIKEIKETIGENPESYEVISFIMNNWTKITGEDESEMFAEQEFNDETIAITEAFGIEYDDLCQNWEE